MGDSDRWSWDRCHDRIATLRGRFGFPGKDRLEFLGLRLDLSSGSLTTAPENTPVPALRPWVCCILATYSRAEERPESFLMVPFRDLPGGPAYDEAFRTRAVLPLASRYARDPPAFCHALEHLGGIPVACADCSWKLYALPRVPVYLLIWHSADEFPASASLFFDASVPAYLETEAAAMLGELVTGQIIRHCGTDPEECETVHKRDA